MSLPDSAVVLAAGVGTRARPLSFARAKAAFPVAGDPLGRRIVAWLARHGVRDVVVNLHHRPETVAQQLGDGADLRVRVRYSWECTILGSAGGPRRALPLIDRPRVFIINGDTLTDLSLGEIADVHARAGALVTMALVRNPDPARYGGVTLNDGWVTGFTTPGAPTPSYHFIGVQVAEAAAFDAVPDDRPSETVTALYPALIARNAHAIRGYVSAARFLDVGTIEDYLATSLAVAHEERRPETLIGAGCDVDESAEITRTVVWDGVTIGAGCRLDECVVADGVRVPAGARFERSVLVSVRDVPEQYAGERAGDFVVAPVRQRDASAPRRTPPKDRPRGAGDPR